MQRSETTSLPLRNRSMGRRTSVYVAGAVLAMTLLASCLTPYDLGLSNELGATATESSTTTIVGSGAASLRLEGWYELQEGSLTIGLTAPDGSQPYVHTYNARSQNFINLTLDPVPGEWVITASTTAGRGSYLVRIVY